MMQDIMAKIEKYTGITKFSQSEIVTPMKRDAGFFVNTLGRMPRHHRSLEQKKLVHHALGYSLYRHTR